MAKSRGGFERKLNAWVKNEETPGREEITQGEGLSGTIQWGEKGGLPNYTETISVILRRVE
jgi:hypothetical protein